ncbi:MAG: cysteine desulfurase family protein [bacterium]|nr:cysteine desulfurase family protein [bacterium]
MTQNRIYLDYAATTPVDPAVERAMRPYFGVRFGNAGSVHSFGQEAIAALDVSRERIAKALGAEFREIVFTGSATEANNLVLRGVVKGIRNYELGIKDDTKQKKSIIHNSNFIIPRIIVSAIEHESVLETAKDLEQNGVEVVYVPVSEEGFIDLGKLKAALNDRTILISVMYANNEVGTIQPLAEISDIIRNFRARNVVDVENVVINQRAEVGDRTTATIRTTRTPYPLFHTDAAQAFQYLPVGVRTLGVDFMTISAHKIYGPKGVGVLYVRNYESGIMNQGSKKAIIRNSKFIIRSVITGGGQEFGLRSGTENVPFVVGAAEAIVRAAAAREKEATRVRVLRDYFWKKLRAAWPGVRLNGGTKKRLPNNLNVWFSGRRAEELLIHLDRRGIAVSSGAACSARAQGPSYVIQALGFSLERARESIRFTLGRQTTKMELDKTVKVIKEIKKANF